MRPSISFIIPLESIIRPEALSRAFLRALQGILREAREIQGEVQAQGDPGDPGGPSESPPPRDDQEIQGGGGVVLFLGSLTSSKSLVPKVLPW